MKNRPKPNSAAAQNVITIRSLCGLSRIEPLKLAQERAVTQIRSTSQWTTANIAKAHIPNTLACVANASPTDAHQIKKYGLLSDNIMPVNIGLSLLVVALEYTLERALINNWIPINTSTVPPINPIAI